MAGRLVRQLPLQLPQIQPLQSPLPGEEEAVDVLPRLCGQRGQHGGGFLILFDRQIAAVRSGIGGQFSLIEGLRGVQHFLRRHAELGGSGFLQGGKTVRQRRGLAFVLPQGFRDKALHAVDLSKHSGNLGEIHEPPGSVQTGLRLGRNKGGRKFSGSMGE